MDFRKFQMRWCLFAALMVVVSRAQGSEKRVDIYQTTNHCSSPEDCSDAGKIPDCKLTLEWQDGQLKLIEIYGLGENNTGMKGFYSLTNTEEGYSNPTGPQVKSNEVKVHGDRIDTKLEATALRWNAYSELFRFNVKGYTPDTIRSVSARFDVRLFGVTGVWIKVNCENLSRFPQEP